MVKLDSAPVGEDLDDADYEYEQWLEKSRDRLTQIYDEIIGLEGKQSDAADAEDQPRYLELKKRIDTLDKEKTELLNKISEDNHQL